MEHPKRYKFVDGKYVECEEVKETLVNPDWVDSNEIPITKETMESIMRAINKCQT